MTDLASLLPAVLSLLFKSAEKGTLVEIVQTAAKLVRLLEPLIGQLPQPDDQEGQSVADPLSSLLGPAQPKDPAMDRQG